MSDPLGLEGRVGADQFVDFGLCEKCHNESESAHILTIWGDSFLRSGVLLMGLV